MASLSVSVIRNGENSQCLQAAHPVFSPPKVDKNRASTAFIGQEIAAKDVFKSVVLEAFG
jgi:hypothetical protein